MEYPKIETAYNRDPDTYKVTPTALRSPTFGAIGEWDWTEKIDGTNVRVIWADQKVSFKGRTDNSQLPAPLLEWLEENITAEALAAAFITTPDAEIVLYGEGCGGNIQAGQAYSPTPMFVLFDVLLAGKFWVNWADTSSIAKKLKLTMVPFIGTMSLEDAAEMVKNGFKSKLGDGTKDAEGLIGRTKEPVFDSNGNRLIVKIKTKDF